MLKQLTPDDMSNLFRLFRVPNKLYTRWATYAKDTKQTMKGALAELLHTCSPGYYYIPKPGETGWWYAPNPKKQDYMEFNMTYTRPLQEEIFNIFMQTGYKNQTPEMNGEIIERLNRALYLKRY